MASEKTLFIVKPEAFDSREDIKSYVLANSDLKIIDSKIIALTTDDVERLYSDDLGTDLLLAIKEHLSGKLVEVCVVEGGSAIEKFLDIAGRNFEGAKCNPKTIRFVFGQLGTVQYGSTTYHLNALHKTGANEVSAALNWFYSK